MSSAAVIRRARPADLESVERLLADARLPLDGAREAFQLGFVAEYHARIVGTAALERFADGALLRSVAVDASARGSGLGTRLTTAAVEEAGRMGIAAVFLLTTTAEDFFRRAGFMPATREAVPASVQQSIEFRSACPASAAVLVLRLR